MRRRLLWAAVLLAAACGPSRVSLELALDELELPSTGAIVGALLPDDDEAFAPHLFKQRLPVAPGNLARLDRLPEFATFYLAVYQEDLAELADGPLTAVPPERSRLGLPAPDSTKGERVVRRAIAGEALGAWSVEPGLPEALGRLRFEMSVCPCVELLGRGHPLGAGGGGLNPAFAVALSEREALVAATDGALFRLSTDGLAPFEPHFPLPTGAALRTRAGALWFFGSGGQAVRTSTASELAFVRAPRNPRGRSIQRALEVLGPRGPYIVTYGQNDLSAFDGERWVHLHDEPGPTHWQVDLAVAGPDEVWTARGNRQSLLRLHGIEVDFEAGTARAEAESITPDPAFGQNLSTLGYVDRLGVVVGAEGFGELYAGGASGFRRLPLAEADLRPAGASEAPSRLGTRAYGVAPLGRGFFAVGALGATAQYQPGLGFCDGERLTGDTITVVVPVGPDLVLLTDGEVRAGTAIYAENRGRPDGGALCGWGR